MPERKRPLIEIYERVTGRKAILFGHPAETMGFTIKAYGTSVGIVQAIRVQDIPRNKWYNWDRPGPWSPSEPEITPGSGTLYIAFYALNNGVAGNLTLTITDDTGATLATKTAYAASGSGVGIEWTGDMPYKDYGISLKVTP
jgi:hypothetical protein